MLDLKGGVVQKMPAVSGHLLWRTLFSVFVWSYFLCFVFVFNVFWQAEEQLRIVEEQRKIHEERMKLEQDRQRQQKEEQKIILGKGKSRPKLSFSLKASEWDCSPFVHMSCPAFIPIQLSLLINWPHSSSSVERSLRFGSAEGRLRKGVQINLLTCSSPWRPLPLSGLEEEAALCPQRTWLLSPSFSSLRHRWLVCFFFWFSFLFFSFFLENLNFWCRML